MHQQRTLTNHEARLAILRFEVESLVCDECNGVFPIGNQPGQAKYAAGEHERVLCWGCRVREELGEPGVREEMREEGEE